MSPGVGLVVCPLLLPEAAVFSGTQPRSWRQSVQVARLARSSGRDPPATVAQLGQPSDRHFWQNEELGDQA